MWYITSNSPVGNRSYGVKSYMADTMKDLKEIPIGSARQGSTVYIIKESATFILGGDKKWAPFSNNNSGSGNSGSDSGTGGNSGGSGSGSGTSGSGSSADDEWTIVDGGDASGASGSDGVDGGHAGTSRAGKENMSWAEY